jgi:hypothetical protein
VTWEYLTEVWIASPKILLVFDFEIFPRTRDVYRFIFQVKYLAFLIFGLRLRGS